MFRACRRVFQRVRRIIAMLLGFLSRYKKKKRSELALYSPSTNNSLNVGASQAGTCPVFAFQIISFIEMLRYKQKRVCLDVTCKQIALKIF
jgi:hypothetical protein